MKMSNNEDLPLDLHLNANRRSNLSSDRSYAPEQELPEVEHEMETENINHSVTVYGEESMSSVSTINNNDSASGDLESNFSTSENQNSVSDLDHQTINFLYIPNSTQSTRGFPYIVTVRPLNPQEVAIPDSIIPETPLLGDVINWDNTSNFSFPIQRYTQTTQASPVVINHDMYISAVSGSDILNNGAVNRNTNIESSNIVDNSSNGQARSTAVTEEMNSVLFGEHPETYNDLNDELTHLFECPVCLEYIVPPIYQCLNGHLICNRCVQRCSRCPSCRIPFSLKRNLYMEKVSYLVKFPCTNALTGCKQQMFIGQKEIHEQSCSYRHFQCFFTNCFWKGYYLDVYNHIFLNHRNSILQGDEQSLDIILPDHSNETNKWLLCAHCEYFAIIAHSSMAYRRVDIQVNYIGQAIKAKDFKFVVTLTQNKDSNYDVAQKLVYERLTLPYSEIYEMSNNNLKKDIVSLPCEVLKPYIKEGRLRLLINVKVNSENNLF